MRIAAYARYSSDQQREASLDDQLRNCRAWCARQGLPEPSTFQDAAISGARLDRPGYARLLAEIHQYDILLVDDLSRLGRDKDEIGKTVKRLTFSGVRLVGVSDGVDTQRRGHKIDVGLRGLMSELYLDDLADKTHRGLTGRALQGASAGGLPYGYRVAGTGCREVDEGQAAVVRRIYSEYLGGRSPREIAARLNADRVPSPRGGTWAFTAIYGDERRGIGILANPIYIGRQVWNRSRWVKHPETGRRVRQERPEAEWIITQHPELAIIDAETWERARARMGNRRYASYGRQGAPRGPGRLPTNLLSGLMRCCACGGPMVVVDKYNYGCSTNKDRGEAACASRLRVPRGMAERAILTEVRDELQSEEAFQRFQRAVTAALRAGQPDGAELQRQLKAAERDRDNIMAAIKAGILTATTKAELENSESAIRGLLAEIDLAKRTQPATVLPRAREIWRQAVDRLQEHARKSPAGREALRDIIGDQITVRQNEKSDLVAEIAFPSASQITMVAGAGFEPATFGL